MIKQEMVLMLHHDSLVAPAENQIVSRKGQQVVYNEQKHFAYLEQNKYDEITEDDMQEANRILEAEMQVVKKGMGHGELSIEAYTQVWEECLSQVLFLPGQNRYTRASLATKKDRLESSEKKLEQNRNQMQKEAKKAAKMEKKLKILTNGYQMRAQALIKQFQDLSDQIERGNMELSTFQFLKDMETVAVPRRLESLTKDLNQQKEREKELQDRYREAQFTLENLTQQLSNM